MSICRLGVPNGEKVIKAKALERLKGDSEAAEQRKKVTVRLAASLTITIVLQGATHWMAGGSLICGACEACLKE